MLRIVPFLELTNASSGGRDRRALLRPGAALTYREYLSNDAQSGTQRAFMPSVYGNLEFGSVRRP